MSCCGRHSLLLSRANTPRTVSFLSKIVNKLKYTPCKLCIRTKTPNQISHIYTQVHILPVTKALWEKHISICIISQLNPRGNSLESNSRPRGITITAYLIPTKSKIVKVLFQGHTCRMRLTEILDFLEFLHTTEQYFAAFINWLTKNLARFLPFDFSLAHYVSNVSTCAVFRFWNNYWKR